MKTIINVEASKTKNYQKYTVGLQREVEHKDDDDLQMMIRYLQAQCRSAVIAQLNLDKE